MKSIFGVKSNFGNTIPQCDFDIRISNLRCDEFDKYRTIDGSCNNVANPTWGQAGTCFERIVAADYYGGKL